MSHFNESAAFEREKLVEKLIEERAALVGQFKAEGARALGPEREFGGAGGLASRVARDSAANRSSINPLLFALQLALAGQKAVSKLLRSRRRG